MCDKLTGHTVNALDLTATTRTIEEVLLLLGGCDLSHCEGDETDLRNRAGRALAWLMGEVNVAAHTLGMSMDDLPYDADDIKAAAAGELTSNYDNYDGMA